MWNKEHKHPTDWLTPKESRCIISNTIPILENKAGYDYLRIAHHKNGTKNQDGSSLKNTQLQQKHTQVQHDMEWGCRLGTKESVEVCRAQIMANNKVKMFPLAFLSQLSICISHELKSDNRNMCTRSGREMNLRLDGEGGRRDKWTVPAGVKVKDWTAKQEDREVVC